MPPEEVVREAVQDGLCSTPVFENDHLYYATPACEVVCASSEGKVLWSYDMMKKLKVVPCFVNSCSPLVAGELVFVTTANGRDAENKLPSPKAPSFVALNKKTGELVWQYTTPADRLLEGNWSNPAYGEAGGKPQVVFPGPDGWLYALEPKAGKLLWKFDCNPKEGVGPKRGRRGPVRNYIIATPVIYDKKVYVGTGLYPDHPYGNSGPGHFWCIDMTKTGDVSAELLVEGGSSPPTVKPNPNSAVVWHFGGMVKPATDTDREVAMGQTISTCAVYGGLVYVAEYTGFLHCLDAKTGRKYWEHDLKSAIWGSPYWVDGKVYLGNEDGDVVVFTHGKEKKVGEPNDMGESINSTPSAAHGVLYVLTRNKLYAITKK
jgi:outer membrane protein assembly factor BamB